MINSRMIVILRKTFVRFIAVSDKGSRFANSSLYNRLQYFTSGIFNNVG